MMRAVNQITPFNPNMDSNLPTIPSYNHSHAIQGLPPILEENGSTRGIACVARICCPVRICQPIPASPSRRVERDVKARAHSSAMNIRSTTDGIIQRTQLAVVTSPGFSSKELLEP